MEQHSMQLEEWWDWRLAKVYKENEGVDMMKVIALDGEITKSKELVLATENTVSEALQNRVTSYIFGFMRNAKFSAAQLYPAHWQ